MRTPSGGVDFPAYEDAIRIIGKAHVAVGDLHPHTDDAWLEWERVDEPHEVFAAIDDVERTATH